MCKHKEGYECLACKFDRAVDQFKEVKIILGFVKEEVNRDESSERETGQARGSNGDLSQTSGGDSRRCEGPVKQG